MTGGFWLRAPDRPDHIRLVFHVDKPRALVWFCDTRRLGRIGWYPDSSAAALAFAGSHGPDALEITRDELTKRLSRTGAGSSRRSWIRRCWQGSAIFTRMRCCTAPEYTPSGEPGRSPRGNWADCTRRSVTSCESRSSWRDRASTRGIERCWVLREVSWLKTRFTAARASPAVGVPVRLPKREYRA